jgi:hypothetical protein
MLKNGVFTISLDFELYWGMRDVRSISSYLSHLSGVNQVVNELVLLFETYNVHATWATVGFLFFSDFNDLKENIPTLLPSYENENYSPYVYLNNELNEYPELHFCPSLIKKIHSSNGQEIGSHTFSHYYCLENGQNIKEFEHDLFASIEAANKHGVTFKSLVFPRNQLKEDYLSLLPEVGITCYRGNERHWIYQASENNEQHKLMRLLRLLDSYLNITGHHTFSLKSCLSTMPMNIPASRFLRAVSNKETIFDKLKLRRIKNSMTYAAKNSLIFHLWWHPHNFGHNIQENISFLKKICDHFQYLKKTYGMESLNMGEISDLGERIR